MKRGPVVMLFALAAVLGCQAPIDRPAPMEEPRAVLIERELVRLASGEPLWPGFDPRTIPLAVFDGERTYLFRHPSPPPSFRPDEKLKDVLVLDGRHEAVTANTSAEIGGTSTATVMAANFSEETSLTEIAAVAIHEAFHVYQTNAHPDWAANEASLFVYPVEDAALLTLSRLETKALGRAFAADGAQACWAEQAAEFRRRRFAMLDEAFIAYERGTELNEGLATYVQLKAASSLDPRMPEEGFAADAVRARAYATGSAYAMLLDALAPAWREDFDTRENAVLDETLRAILEEPGERTKGCGFQDDEISLTERRALADIGALLQARLQSKTAFLERQGYRIEIRAADNSPLMLRGFDPLNVSRLSDREILHTRFLRLGTGSGEIEILAQKDADISALTVGTGPHPIFNGVETVTIVTPGKPHIDAGAEKTALTAPGFAGSFSTAETEIETTGNSVIIRLKQ